MIEISDMIANYDFDHHRRQADAYFAGIGPTHPVMRKPFVSPGVAIDLLPGVGAIVSALNLFDGARVLDLGCGGGWLTRIFSFMGCEAHGVDIAASAVAVARQSCDQDPALRSLKYTFGSYDGRTIPYPDAFFDAAVVFDAFHHIVNQQEVLRELNRVLRPGGSVAFHEPGPHHSRSPDSQAEMRNYGVVERDMVMADVELMAVTAGFEVPRMAVFTPVPYWCSLSDFDQIIGGGGEPWHDQRLREHASIQFRNLRVFSLRKPGKVVRDSRQNIGLTGRLDLLAVKAEGQQRIVTVRAQNTGTAVWLASGAYVGAVNVGINRVQRVMLSGVPVAPGEGVTIDIVLADAAPATIDLVAEGIDWFETRGAQPLVA